MSELEPLCEYCVHVPLEPERIEERSQCEWRLGSGARIKNSRCPLCRLVKHTLYAQERIESDYVQTRLSDETDIILRWYSGGGPGGREGFSVTTSHHWICFAAPADADSPTHGPYYLRPKLSPELDVSRVSRWLSTCASAHITDCNVGEAATFEHAFPGLRVLRLIDVRQNCLVETQTIPQYVALSYVWGAVPNFRLTGANKHKLSITGGIRAVWNWLPRTIRDAVEFTRMLGLRYLWVDALCLLQNDEEDLKLGVAVMDQVYERSWLTIMAASGHDANAGLPGVREGSREPSVLTLEVKRGISLGVYTPLDLLYKYTVHNSRAWTFQESVLPRRTIYFLDNAVLFRCRSAEYTENFLDHPRPSEPDFGFVSLLPMAVSMLDPLPDFAVMLLYYTKRALTNQVDVLRAMEGTIRRFSAKAKCRFLEGLPTAALDAFIAFQSTDAILHRRAGFPSYSWVGWRGQIDINHPWIENNWLWTKTWIVWYKRSPSGVTNLVWDPAANESFPTTNPEYIGYRERRPFQSTPALRIATSRTTPTEVLAFDPPQLTYPLLQFWTLAVFYEIANINVFTPSAKLITKDGAVCGTIRLDGFEETKFFDSGGIFELILLSKYDRNHYNAMLLEWDSRVAERRGMGTIEQSAIGKSFPPGPVWKEILLA